MRWKQWGNQTAEGSVCSKQLFMKSTSLPWENIDTWQTKVRQYLQMWAFSSSLAPFVSSFQKKGNLKTLSLLFQESQQAHHSPWDLSKHKWKMHLKGGPGWGDISKNLLRTLVSVQGMGFFPFKKNTAWVLNLTRWKCACWRVGTNSEKIVSQ